MEFQSTLFTNDGAGIETLHPERTRLDAHSWLDVQRSWVADADAVFAALVQEVPWRAEQRKMFDHVVDVPRLVHTYHRGQHLPHPLLHEMRTSLSTYYAAELGEEFVSAGCCFYRDGRDSVAWHGDNLGRGRTHDTMVAIVSLGDERRLMLRPRGGGISTSLTLGHGDLVVMGGACQREWEHSVPKQASAGPRISVQFRPLNVF